MIQNLQNQLLSELFRPGPVLRFIQISHRFLAKHTNANLAAGLRNLVKSLFLPRPSNGIVAGVFTLSFICNPYPFMPAVYHKLKFILVCFSCLTVSPSSTIHLFFKACSKNLLPSQSWYDTIPAALPWPPVPKATDTC